MDHSILRLTLVRHGETEGESSIRYYGRTDVPLSRLGRAQMARVREALASRRFVAVYTSSLSRANEAALIISGAATGDGGPTPTRVSGFDEIDFGEWEGLTAEEIRARYPRLHAEWEAHRGGDFTYPGGDSTRGFRERVVQALREVLAHAPSGEVLFVLHKGVIRCIVAELLGLDGAHRAKLNAEIASIHVLACDHGAWSAEALDCTEHL
jgi:broad specificity phosphatase PhoE